MPGLFDLLPGPLCWPGSVAVAANTTLGQRLNYYEDLTIPSGVTLTGVSGGTIIVCFSTLRVDGTLSVNGLGAAGGPSHQPGNGGGAWGRFLSNAIRTQGGFLSAGSIATGIPYAAAPALQAFMADGGGSADTAVAGSPGSAWPSATGSLFDAQALDPGDLPFLQHLIQLILLGGGSHSFGRVIGGGGGGGGAQQDWFPGLGGQIGARGQTGTGPGGSGFGGGGGGGNTAATNQVQAGAGGAGGGVLAIYCHSLAGSGTISANGGDGNPALGDGGNGGGGGGGAVVVAYRQREATIPTLQANGGIGPNSAGAGAAGGNGGAGIALSFQIGV